MLMGSLPLWDFVKEKYSDCMYVPGVWAQSIPADHEGAERNRILEK